MEEWTLTVYLSDDSKFEEKANQYQNIIDYLFINKQQTRIHNSEVVAVKIVKNGL